MFNARARPLRVNDVHMQTLAHTPLGVYSVVMNLHDKNMKSVLRRLSILEGQIRGLRDLIEKGAYCVDIITQTSAVKQGLSNVEDILLEGHLSTCTLNHIKSGHEKKAIDEILKVYKLKRK